MCPLRGAAYHQVSAPLAGMWPSDTIVLNRITPSGSSSAFEVGHQRLHVGHVLEHLERGDQVEAGQRRDIRGIVVIGIVRRRIPAGIDEQAAQEPVAAAVIEVADCRRLRHRGDRADRRHWPAAAHGRGRGPPGVVGVVDLRGKIVAWPRVHFRRKAEAAATALHVGDGDSGGRKHGASRLLARLVQVEDIRRYAIGVAHRTSAGRAGRGDGGGSHREGVLHESLGEVTGRSPPTCMFASAGTHSTLMDTMPGKMSSGSPAKLFGLNNCARCQ